MRIIPVLECYFALGCVVPSLHTWAVTIPFIPWLMGKPDEKQMVCDNGCFFFSVSLNGSRVPAYRRCVCKI